jgi:NAD(P)-dependent dehydrogenase (short-subunit alcohol dehydrogenase family)
MISRQETQVMMLKDQVAVVTGADQGIGAASAKALAGAGAIVVVVDIDGRACRKYGAGAGGRPASHPGDRGRRMISRSVPGRTS